MDRRGRSGPARSRGESARKRPQDIQGYYSYRGEIAVGIWEVLGETKTEFLVDWFYSETADAQKSRGSNNKTFFLTQMPGILAPADRKLFARMVRDPRLEELGDMELEYVIVAVHRWAPFERSMLTMPGVLDPRVRAERIKKLRASIPKWEKP